MTLVLWFRDNYHHDENAIGIMSLQCRTTNNTYYTSLTVHADPGPRLLYVLTSVLLTWCLTIMSDHYCHDVIENIPWVW